MPEQMTPFAQSYSISNVADSSATTGNETPIIKTERLSKRLRGVQALRNLSITVKPGEVYGLAGAQGAGKSTLAHLLLGFLRPDGGTIRLFGSEHLDRARIGYLPERPRYHSNFTGRDYLRFHAELSGLKGRDAQLVAGRVADSVGLGGAERKLIRGYSKPLRQRLGLAVALLAGGPEPPELLVLDEPATGLDEEVGETFANVVLDCKSRGSTVLICSRELTQVERVCTSLGILRAGRLLLQTHIDESPRVHLVAVAREGAEEILADLVHYLGNLHPAAAVRSSGERLHVVLPGGPDVPHATAIKAAALRAMVDARWDILSVYTENRDLESLFMQALPLSDSKAKALKSPSTGVLPAVTDASTRISSQSKSADTGPLVDEPPVLGVAEIDGTSKASPATGPLSMPETEVEVAGLRSPDTGPLGMIELGGIAGGAGDEDGNSAGGRTIPATSPLPAFDPTAGANGYEAALPPLPVRALSIGRRAGAVVAEGESVNGDDGA
jgi:ABC-2 type transport system ATP-binding protein